MKLCGQWMGALLLAGICALGWSAPVRAQTPVPTTAAPADVDGQPDPAALPPGYVPGVVLAGVRGDVTQVAALDAVTPLAMQPLDLRGLDGGAGDDGVVGMRLEVPPGTEAAAIAALQADPNVVFAEYDWLASIAQVDPAAAPQVAVETPFTVTDGLYGRQWYLQRINMSRAWSAAINDTADGLTTIRVAVIDTGVDRTHPDLAGHLLLGRNYLVPGTPPTDDNGHGTHIAGLIASVLDNGGMAGTALDVLVDPIKVLAANGSGPTTAIAEAIRNAAVGGARIINLSLTLDEDSTPLRAAIAYAVDQDALVVAAAGNCYFKVVDNKTVLVCPPPVLYPALYPGVLAVAASSYSDARTYYSAKGPELDLTAPGGLSGASTSILSTWSSHVSAVQQCRAGLLTTNNAAYCMAEGTSMAAGLVSGVAALVLSVRPDLSAAELEDLLKETAAVIPGSASEIGVGRLDAAAAVRAALPPRLTGLPTELHARVAPDGPPVSLTIPLVSPALEPLTWSITRTAVVSWFDIGGPLGGVVSYGAPATAQIVVTPTELITGTSLSGLRLTTVAPDGSESIYQIAVRAEAARFERTLLPWVSGSSAPYTWLTPGLGSRAIYTPTNPGSVAVSLPFPFVIKGRTFGDMRIYGDGLVTFPAATVVESLPSRCLTNQATPGLAIYGWWANLDPGAPGSRISVFQPDADRLVVEYMHVPSAPGVTPAYVVDLQIVLHRDGTIRLTYRDVPPRPPARVTIGVEAVDGRFANQIACRTDELQLGDLPQDEQSLLIRPEDLY